MPARLKFLEAAIWVAAAAIAAMSAWFAPRPFAAATAVGATLAGLNFTLARLTLRRLAKTARLARLGYGFLYLLKFFALIALLARLVIVEHMPGEGLALGFMALPAALYALLMKELIARAKAQRAL